MDIFREEPEKNWAQGLSEAIKPVADTYLKHNLDVMSKVKTQQMLNALKLPQQLAEAQAMAPLINMLMGGQQQGYQYAPQEQQGMDGQGMMEAQGIQQPQQQPNINQILSSLGMPTVGRTNQGLGQYLQQPAQIPQQAMQGNMAGQQPYAQQASQPQQQAPMQQYAQQSAQIGNAVQAAQRVVPGITPQQLAMIPVEGQRRIWDYAQKAVETDLHRQDIALKTQRMLQRGMYEQGRLGNQRGSKIFATLDKRSNELSEAAGKSFPNLSNLVHAKLLNEEGNLTGQVLASFMKSIGLGNFIGSVNKDSALYDANVNTAVGMFRTIFPGGTDAQLRAFVEELPDLTKTKEGRDVMLDFLLKEHVRSIRNNDVYNAYVGQFDEQSVPYNANIIGNQKITESTKKLFAEIEKNGILSLPEFQDYIDAHRVLPSQIQSNIPFAGIIPSLPASSQRSTEPGGRPSTSSRESVGLNESGLNMYGKMPTPEFLGLENAPIEEKQRAWQTFSERLATQKDPIGEITRGTDLSQLGYGEERPKTTLAKDAMRIGLQTVNNLQAMYRSGFVLGDALDLGMRALGIPDEFRSAVHKVLPSHKVAKNQFNMLLPKSLRVEQAYDKAFTIPLSILAMAAKDGALSSVNKATNWLNNLFTGGDNPPPPGTGLGNWLGENLPAFVGANVLGQAGKAIGGPGLAGEALELGGEVLGAAGAGKLVDAAKGIYDKAQTTRKLVTQMEEKAEARIKNTERQLLNIEAAPRKYDEKIDKLKEQATNYYDKAESVGRWESAKAATVLNDLTNIKMALKTIASGLSTSDKKVLNTLVGDIKNGVIDGYLNISQASDVLKSINSIIYSGDTARTERFDREEVLRVSKPALNYLTRMKKTLTEFIEQHSSDEFKNHHNKAQQKSKEYIEMEAKKDKFLEQTTSDRDFIKSQLKKHREVLDSITEKQGLSRGDLAIPGAATAVGTLIKGGAGSAIGALIGLAAQGARMSMGERSRILRIAKRDFPELYRMAISQARKPGTYSKTPIVF